VHTRKVLSPDDVESSIIARGTPGFSGADLANLVTKPRSGRHARIRKICHDVDFEMAKDKVLMGVERKSMILSDEEKKNTCFQRSRPRAGCGIDARRRSVHKVTIIPRGRPSPHHAVARS